MTCSGIASAPAGLLRRWRAWRRYREALAVILDAGYSVSPQTRQRLLLEAREETP